MGTLKPVNLPSGVSVSYWKLLRFNPLLEQGVVEVYWQGWLSPEAKAGGATHVRDADFMETIEIPPLLWATLYAFATPPGSRLHGAEPYLANPWRPDPPPVEPAPEPVPVAEPVPEPTVDPAAAIVPPPSLAEAPLAPPMPAEVVASQPPPPEA